MTLEEENYNFTAHEQDRIARFIHVARGAAQERSMVAEGQEAKVEASWIDENRVKHTKRTFYIDKHLVRVMEDIAFNMYYGNPKLGVPGLRDHENTKWAADCALGLIQKSFPQEADIYVAQCEEIWKRT